MFLTGVQASSPAHYSFTIYFLVLRLLQVVVGIALQNSVGREAMDMMKAPHDHIADLKWCTVTLKLELLDPLLVIKLLAVVSLGKILLVAPQENHSNSAWFSSGSFLLLLLWN